MSLPRALLRAEVMLLLCLAIIDKPILAAGTVTESAWDNLKTLAPGQRIRVILNNAKSVEGNLESVTAEALSVKQASGVESYARQDILRVSTKGQKHRGRNALLGAAGGAAVGLGIGALIDHNEGCRGAHGSALFGPCILGGNAGKIVMPPVGAVGGVVTQILVPTRGWHDVYRVR